MVRVPTAQIVGPDYRVGGGETMAEDAKPQLARAGPEWPSAGNAFVANEPTEP
jgi:hypothetical protein